MTRSVPLIKPHPGRTWKLFLLETLIWILVPVYSWVRVIQIGQESLLVPVLYGMLAALVAFFLHRILQRKRLAESPGKAYGRGIAIFFVLQLTWISLLLPGVPWIWIPPVALFVAYLFFPVFQQVKIPGLIPGFVAVMGAIILMMVWNPVATPATGACAAGSGICSVADLFPEGMLVALILFSLLKPGRYVAPLLITLLAGGIGLFFSFASPLSIMSISAAILLIPGRPVQSRRGWTAYGLLFGISFIFLLVLTPIEPIITTTSGVQFAGFRLLVALLIADLSLSLHLFFKQRRGRISRIETGKISYKK